MACKKLKVFGKHRSKIMCYNFEKKFPECDLCNIIVFCGLSVRIAVHQANI
jgi:hypothetical protein